MARRLAAVTDGATAPAKAERVLTVQAAAESNDQRKLLVAMRARIADAVGDPNTPARDLAALTRRLLEIAKDLKALDAAEDGDDVSRAAATPDEAWVAN